MKILFLVTIFFCFSNFSYSQWNTNGQNVYHFGNVGINDPIPGTALVVKGNVMEESVLVIKNNFTSNLFSYASGDIPHINASFVMNRSRGTVELPLSLAEGDRIGGLFARPFIDGHYRRTAAIHMYVGASPGINSYPSNIRFETTGTNEVDRTERMRIDENGNIGIGTSEPKAKLEVADGDIFISEIKNGIIMKSPDGNCWRGTLNDAGSLNFIQIDCPENSITKIQALKSQNQVTAYPNPTNDKLYIHNEAGVFNKATYVVFDMAGKQLEQGKIKSNYQQINTASFDPGLYLINIIDNKGRTIATTKIIKE